MNARDRQHWQAGLLGALMGAAVMAWMAPSGDSARAEVRRTTPADADQHFKSGGRLAESVLQEILVVLKRMDERLERMETAIPERSRTGAVLGVPGTELAPTSAPATTPEIKIRRSR